MFARNQGLELCPLAVRPYLRLALTEQLAVDGLGYGESRSFTWFTIVVAHVTGTIPALLLLSGAFATTVGGAVAVGIGAIAAALVAIVIARQARGVGADQAAPEVVVG